MMENLRALQLTPAGDETLSHRLRGEFIETPGFSPTISEAMRLFHLPYDQCRRVLLALVAEGFLRQTRKGRYSVA